MCCVNSKMKKKQNNVDQNKEATQMNGILMNKYT